MALMLTSLAAPGLMANASAAGTPPLRVHVYNWSDYIAPRTIPAFTRLTGIRVDYDVLDSNEVLEGKLLAGRTGYDVVVPTAYFLARQIKAGVFRKLDKALIPNLKGLDPHLMAELAKVDPSNAYGVPYMWGTTGIGYNAAMVRKALGPDAPLDSWKLVFDPQYLDKLKSCGVAFLDAPTDVMPAALHYLGLNPNTRNPVDYEKAFKLLQKLRPDVRYFNSSQYISDLAQGKICVAIGWSGDVLQAAERAAAAKQGVKITYVIPRTGAQLWFDMLAVPADAPHPKQAFAFINYLLAPRVEAQNTNHIRYANPVPASLAYIDTDIRDNPAIYPPPTVMRKLFVLSPPSPTIMRTMLRYWTRLKTGS
ncbi:polyamine ABC transporter substrate-binding protein [Acidihalobacter ferrooxydans]